MNGWRRLFVLSFRRGVELLHFLWSDITLYSSNPIHTPSQIRALSYDVQDLGLLRVSLYNSKGIFIFIFSFWLAHHSQENCAFYIVARQTGLTVTLLKHLYALSPPGQPLTQKAHPRGYAEIWIIIFPTSRQTLFSLLAHSNHHHLSLNLPSPQQSLPSFQPQRQLYSQSPLSL